MSLFGNHGVFDDIGRFVGKAARNPVVEGAVGALVPGGALVSGALGALGRASQPGANFGDIAKSGLGGYGAGIAGQGIRSGIGALTGGGGAAAPESITPIAPTPTGAIPSPHFALDGNLGSGLADAASAPASPYGASGLALGNASAGLPAATSAGAAPSSFLSSVGHGLRDTGSFLAKNPQTFAAGLNAVSQYTGPQSRLLNAQADTADYDLARRRRIDEGLSQFLNDPYFAGVQR